ncbi:MAG TPA: EamA family transporter [Symbiobacteriaceae bacterium]|nr:EamA family transporter [Symbiobacteriaceae bacterium]
MQQTATASSPKTISSSLYTALALLFTLLWASAFMAVKVGLRSSPPLFLMAVRFLIAGALLLLWSRLRGYSFPRSPREWARVVLIGLLNNAGYLGVAGLALRNLSGGMGAVIASTNPLMLAMVAPLFLRERLTPVKVTGFLLAFGSVFAVMYTRTGSANQPGAMALMLFANALMVTGTILFKRWAPRQELTVMNGVQLLASGLVLMVPSLLLEPVAAVGWNLSLLGAVAYLALAVSCGAMIIWYQLLRTGDASKASAFFFLNPVVGLFLGALLLGEPLYGFDLVGTVGVAAGIYMVQR